MGHEPQHHRGAKQDGGREEPAIEKSAHERQDQLTPGPCSCGTRLRRRGLLVASHASQALILPRPGSPPARGALLLSQDPHLPLKTHRANLLRCSPMSSGTGPGPTQTPPATSRHSATFHQTLKTFPPRGYRGSRILLVEGAPCGKSPARLRGLVLPRRLRCPGCPQRSRRERPAKGASRRGGPPVPGRSRRDLPSACRRLWCAPPGVLVWKAGGDPLPSVPLAGTARRAVAAPARPRPHPGVLPPRCCPTRERELPCRPRGAPLPRLTA